ncbi:nuclear distribution protein nudF [Jackrogersella minutella]|nr:nuclear distribution protein nudF [Jackrogersella minutella]
MASILSSKQTEELHKSIIAYLSANNLPNAAGALRTELSLGEDVFDPATTKKYETLLEKKWIGIVRLQRKIMELESENATLKAEVEKGTSIAVSKRHDPVSWLPQSPPRHALESHRKPVNCIAFHPTFSSIASGSDDCTVKIWDWELGELERTIKGHTRAVLDVDYGGPRGGVILASCSSDLTIKLWDPAEEYKNIRTLAGHEHSVSAVRFIPSGNLLVSASRDESLRIWDATTGFCVRTLRGHVAWVRDVCPSPDGQFLLSTGDDMTARLWNISTSTPEIKTTMIGHEHFNECCALAPPSSYPYLAALAGLKKPPPASSSAEFMATGSRDKTIRFWDARGTCLATLRGHDNWVRAIAFHPGGKFLLSVADDKTLRCWDLSQSGRCVKTIGDAHDHFISCLRWVPEATSPNNGQPNMPNAENGAARLGSGQANAANMRIRCVVATGGVDQKLRIFAT